MAKSKKVKVEDYRAMSDEAIVDQIDEQTRNLMKMKFSHAVNPIENPATIRTVRRQVARLKTEQTKRKSASK